MFNLLDFFHCDKTSDTDPINVFCYALSSLAPARAEPARFLRVLTPTPLAAMQCLQAMGSCWTRSST